MARYIRADELLKTARDGYHSDFGRSMADLTSLREVIEDTPTADVVEVKRGKWIKKGNEKKCSTCEFIYYSNNDEWNYCPNCGAKMDLNERKEN